MFHCLFWQQNIKYDSIKGDKTGEKKKLLSCHFFQDTQDTLDILLFILCRINTRSNVEKKKKYN